MSENLLPLPGDLVAFITEWKPKPGNLVMVLHRVQETYGYIPHEVVVEVSRLLEMPLAKIYGVVTFYHFFSLKKPGKHKIAVCMGTACYLKGGQALLDEIASILQCHAGEVSEDGKFSVDSVRCIGCCGLAPVLTIDGKVYGDLTPAKIAGLIAPFQNES
ncbi:NADH dehydrogenase [Planctomycetales bacterium]|nr:NADH dehydrogenase [Planctomycetales bacterium]GHV21756.1 NADH dehydrogenase [Planctomycetales bacterium]